jgi:hypothetical protein
MPVLEMVAVSIMAHVTIATHRTTNRTLTREQDIRARHLSLHVENIKICQMVIYCSSALKCCMCFLCDGARTFSYDSAQRYPFMNTIRTHGRFSVGRKLIELFENGSGDGVGLGHAAVGYGS